MMTEHNKQFENIMKSVRNQQPGDNQDPILRQNHSMLQSRDHNLIQTEEKQNLSKVESPGKSDLI